MFEEQTMRGRGRQRRAEEQHDRTGYCLDPE
jgi:hypothetical protein